MYDLENEYILYKKKKKKKKIIFVIALAIVLVIALNTFIYYINLDYREFVDKYIFNNEIALEQYKYIDIDPHEEEIFCYLNNVGKIDKSSLKLYNKEARCIKEFNINFTQPVYDIAGRFLAVASKNSNQIYIFENNELRNTLNIDGKIQDIKLNKNGYICVNLKDDIYNSIVEVYRLSELKYKRFFSEDKIINMDISEDNQYIALACINTNGININSNVKKIRYLALNDEIEEYLLDGKLVYNVNFFDKNKVVALLNDEIVELSQNIANCVLNFNDEDIAFQSIDLKDNIVLTNAINSKEDGNVEIYIQNILSGKRKEYRQTKDVKGISANEKIALINSGDVVSYIKPSGLMKKRIVSEEEITNIYLSETCSVIVVSNRAYIVEV